MDGSALHSLRGEEFQRLLRKGYVRHGQCLGGRQESCASTPVDYELAAGQAQQHAPDGVAVTALDAQLAGMVGNVLVVVSPVYRGTWTNAHVMATLPRTMERYPLGIMHHPRVRPSLLYLAHERYAAMEVQTPPDWLVVPEIAVQAALWGMLNTATGGFVNAATVSPSTIVAMCNTLSTHKAVDRTDVATIEGFKKDHATPEDMWQYVKQVITKGNAPRRLEQAINAMVVMYNVDEVDPIALEADVFALVYTDSRWVSL